MKSANKVQKYCKVEDYINYLVKEQRLLPEQVTIQELPDHNKMITVNGRIRIDGREVQPDLDWSIVTAKQAIFDHFDEPAVSSCTKLPYTTNGVSGNIPRFDNYEILLAKSAFGRYRPEGNSIVVEGNLSVHQMSDMDLGKLTVNGKVLWYSPSPIDYEKLPTAETIMGLQPEKIKRHKSITDKDLQAKGVVISAKADNWLQRTGRALFSRHTPGEA